VCVLQCVRMYAAACVWCVCVCVCVVLPFGFVVLVLCFCVCSNSVAHSRNLSLFLSLPLALDHRFSQANRFLRASNGQKEVIDVDVWYVPLCMLYAFLCMRMYVSMCVCVYVHRSLSPCALLCFSPHVHCSGFSPHAHGTHSHNHYLTLSRSHTHTRTQVCKRPDRYHSSLCAHQNTHIVRPCFAPLVPVVFRRSASSLRV